MGLGQPETERDNRWIKFQTRSGLIPIMKMHDLYVDIKSTLKAYLNFSSAILLAYLNAGIISYLREEELRGDLTENLKDREDLAIK